MITLGLIRNGPGPKPLENVSFVAHGAILIGSTAAAILYEKGRLSELSGRMTLAATATLLNVIVNSVNDTFNKPHVVSSVKVASSIVTSCIVYRCLF